jgi:drug/metabolite transporter (DMT)-like permease
MEQYIAAHSGELASLLTAFLWTLTALVFESASLKVGSLPVNFIRLFMGLFFLSVFTFFYRGHFLPTDATLHNWTWLGISGLIGFTFGDFFLFKSYTIIGSRFAMLIMTLVPPLTAFLGWLALGEKLSGFNYLGMGLTFTGIFLAIFNRKAGGRRFSLKLAPRGIFYAFFGALGQAAGLVASKYGMQGYNAFATTQIRIIFGIAGFTILILISKKFHLVFRAMKNSNAVWNMAIGSFFGLFLGVSLSQYAIKHTETGIASTIMALVPVLIIPPAVILYKQKVVIWEVVGAILSVAGVSLFFIL